MHDVIVGGCSAIAGGIATFFAIRNNEALVAKWSARIAAAKAAVGGK